VKFKRAEPSISKAPPINKPRPKVIPPPPSFRPQPESAHFILVKLQPKSIKKALQKLKRIKGISGFHPVYGEYDIVIIIREREGVNKKKIIQMIQKHPDVIDAQTLIAAS
jgi:DNA-binding Lrp family transcriptional regulator